MYVVFLAGGIASGKSTVAGTLESLGALRIDLDALSREATQAGSATNALIADEFGADVVDAATGELRRGVLAGRAFADEGRTQALERIVHPAIRALLLARLDAAASEGTPVVVVEVPLLNKVEDLLPLADEVLCVTCPLGLRRERAVRRGVEADDFDARVRQQPTDDYLLRQAHTHLRNDVDKDALVRAVTAWWEARAVDGWERR